MNDHDAEALTRHVAALQRYHDKLEADRRSLEQSVQAELDAVRAEAGRYLPGSEPLAARQQALSDIERTMAEVSAQLNVASAALGHPHAGSAGPLQAGGDQTQTS